MNRKVFIGLSNTAGYGTRLIKGFRKAGLSADFYSPDKHPFGYDESLTKKIKRFSNIWINRFYMRYFLFKCLIKYDAFIFFSGDSLLSKYRDFKYYHFFKKKTMMIFLGCDLQQPELTRRENIPYSACHNCKQDYKDFVGCVPELKLIRTKAIEEITDIIVSHKAFSDSLQKEYINIIQPINIEEFPEIIDHLENSKPVILHAPSNFGYKGTEFLIQAIERLKSEFDFEFRLVQNVSIKTLFKEIEKADLIVDQLIQGWFGMLPLEAMMYEKPVICYMRDDVLKVQPPDNPMINANPSTIYEVLKRMLEDTSTWKDIGKAGRKYVIKHHDAKIIAKHYSDLLLK